MFEFLLIAFFLFFTMYIAWKKILTNKYNDFKTYAIGTEQNFNLTSLVCTLVATHATASFIFNDISNIYHKNLYYFIPKLMFPFNIILCGYLSMRMHEFSRKLSVAEAMGSLYGNTTRVSIAILGIIGRLGHIIIQFKVIAYAFTLLFGIHSFWATVIPSIILIGYTMLGGIKIVVLTDLYQFAIFSMFLLFISFKIFLDIQKHPHILQSFTQHIFLDFQWDRSRVIDSLQLFFFASLPIITLPETFQRFSLHSDLKVIKKSFKQSGGIILIMTLIVSWIGFLLLLNTQQNLLKTQEQVIPYFIQNYISPNFKGIFIICILALGMSSADSFLHSISVLFANDVVKVITKQKKASIRTAKLFIGIIGLFCLILSFWEKNIFSIIYIFGGFYMTVALIPIALTFLGFRTHKKVILTSMLAGVITTLLWSFLYGNSTSILPGITVNILTFFITHYLFGFQGGWIQFTPDSPLGQLRVENKFKRLNFWNQLKNFNLTSYIQRNTLQDNSLYFYFGLYIFITDFVYLHTLDYSDTNPYISVLYLTVFVIISLMTFLFTCPIWTSKVNSKLLFAFWMIVLFTSFFASIILYILSSFSLMQFVFMILNLLILGFSVDFTLLLILFTLSFIASLLCFQYYGCNPFSSTNLLNIPESIFFGTILFLSLIRKIVTYRIENQELKEKNNLLCSKMQKKTEKDIKYSN